MFTGIVEEIGIVESVRANQLTISASTVLEGTHPGDSMAINGACLTVTALKNDSFSVEVMPETLHRTNLGLLRHASKVNLERALLMGGRLGGHLVQGHVDATGKVLSLIPQGEALIARYSATPETMRYVVEKGFVCVDGVSVTVIDRDTTSFSVSLVSYTLQRTTLGNHRSGDTVNLEVDIIAKYVEQLLGRSDSSLTFDLLAEHGFISRGRR